MLGNIRLLCIDATSEYNNHGPQKDTNMPRNAEIKT